MKKHARYRCAGDVSGGRGSESRRLDHGRVPESRRSLPQGRQSLRYCLGETSDNVDTVGAFFLAFGAEVVDARAMSS